MRETSSRMLFVGVVGWVSFSLLLASWFPALSENLRFLWMITGLTGLVSAVGLAEIIKADAKRQDQLLHEYMEAAVMDGLTGLANRQALDKALRSALSNHDSQRNPLSLIMFDIDHFKQFNDQYGHQAGDEILRAVAQQAVVFFSRQGCVARYGGEEFAIVLPGIKLKNAFLLADEFRKTIEKLTCAYRGQQMRVTISAGVTEAKSQETADEVIRRADLGLYTSKKMGRNCVWFGESATELPTESSLFQLGK